MYRYRDNAGSTHHSLERMKHLPKVGRVLLVRGYEYVGRYGALHTGILVKGDKGSCRFGGFCFGYGGEGPRGLVRLLLALGVPQKTAEAVAFNVPRQDKPGIVWEIEFAHFFRLKMPAFGPLKWQEAA
jgi:hypothetical protein